MNGLSRRAFLQRSAALAAAAAFPPALLLARPEAGPMIERAAFTMGSIVTIKAYGGSDCRSVIEEAIAAMKTVDRLLSVYDAQSELSAVNRLAYGSEVAVSSGMLAVLGEARRFWEITGGAFDVTVEPLMELYGFRDEADRHRYPSDREITDRLAGVGMGHVILDRDRSTVRFDHERTRLDFGGIGVGFALDRAAHILRSGGVRAALINHSGDLYAIGAPPGAEAWEIGITDPRNTAGIITTVGIRDQALSTSGNYEEFIEADGRRVGHLLDPANGRTASSMLSGTAIAATAIEADALSTGCFILGIERTGLLLRRFSAERFIAVVGEGEEARVIEAGCGVPFGGGLQRWGELRTLGGKERTNR